MSLITRCPTCETMFKVVPDQLRVSEGWVRCGHCSEIFDASKNMLPPPGQLPQATKAPPTARSAAVLPPARPAAEAAPPAVSAGAAPAPEIPAAAAPAPIAVPETTHSHAVPAAPSQASGAWASDPHVEMAPAVDFAAINPDTRPKVASDRVVLTAPGVAEPLWSDAPETDPQTALIDMPASMANPPPTRHAPAMPNPDVVGHKAMPKISFLNDGDSPSFWQRRRTRIVLLVLMLGLLVALGVQILLSQRDRIAAIEPSTRPVLLALCAWQGCSLAPLRQIESVVIDSSSFSRIGDSNYRLGFSLKNNAAVDIAMPAIELALTDPQDQAVIRRVILPGEFGADSPSLTRASVWTGSIALNVKPIANADRIAGYRLLAFYP